MQTVHLSLGSNLGERESNIARAIAEMNPHGVRVRRSSVLYETEPVDFLDQPWFLNCALEAETSLSPEQLMDAMLQIERDLGRERLIPRGPRLIDIDILFYGSCVVHRPGLEIPHPRLVARRFVLAPMNEIAPEFRDPVSNKTMAELLALTGDRSEVRPWK
jgi:2-amino-4-hydroxy-6-hydroxymethyldihydropteridine diphosphokinase